MPEACPYINQTKLQVTMKTFYFPIIGLLLILFAGGCGEIGADRGAREALERADAVLDAMPDSAMAIVAGIDTARLNTEKLRADYSLLRTMALLKTDPSAATEEGLKASYDYYGDSDEPLRQAMLTHFAKGLLATSIKPAFEGFNRAIKLAAGENAVRYKGMALLNKSRYYHGTMNQGKERLLINMGLECVAAANDTSALAYGYLLSGNAYIGCQKNDSAVAELKKAIALSEAAGDDDTGRQSVLSLAYAKSQSGCDEDAIEGFTQIIAEGKLPLSTYDINAFVRSLVKAGRMDEAEYYRNLIPDNGTSSQKSDRFYTQSVMMSAKGDYGLAAALKDSTTAYANIAMMEKRNGVTPDPADLDHEYIMADVSAQRTWQSYLWYVLAAVVVTAASLSVFYRRKHKRIKVEKSETDALNRSQREEIDALNKTVEEFRKNNGELSTRLAALEEDCRFRNMESKESVKKLSEVRDAMKSEFIAYHGRIATFCNRYSTPKARGKASADLLERREEFLDGYRGNENFRHLMEQFDTVTGGELNEFLESRKMNPKETLVIVYGFLGFDYNVISELTGLSSGNVATIRCRLKVKLGNVSFPGVEMIGKRIEKRG